MNSEKFHYASIYIRMNPKSSYMLQVLHVYLPHPCYCTSSHGTLILWTQFDTMCQFDTDIFLYASSSVPYVSPPHPCSCTSLHDTLILVQVRTITVDNIEKILERGDKIELLVDKTATMQDSAFHFRKQSKRLRRALWMKNAKLL